MMVFSKKNRSKGLGIVLFLGFSILGTSAQPVDRTGRVEFPSTCEEAIYSFDLAMQKNENRRGKAAAFIIVNRLGAGEKESTAAKRIESLRTYLSARKPSFEVLVLKGDSNSGLGRVQFYIDGVLGDEIRYAKNQVIELQTCSIP